MKINRGGGSDCPERSGVAGGVITTYHLWAPGSSHHQVVSHSMVQRFTDEAKSPCTVYTHTHAHRGAYSHLHTRAHTHAHRQAACQLLTRQIGRGVYSMASVHIPTGLHLFENDWTRENNVSVWLDGILSKLVLFCIWSPLLPSHSPLLRWDFSLLGPVITIYSWYLPSLSRTILQIWSPTTASTFSACPSGCTLTALSWWSSVTRPLMAQRTRLHSTPSTSRMLHSTCKLCPDSHSPTCSNTFAHQTSFIRLVRYWKMDV